MKHYPFRRYPFMLRLVQCSTHQKKTSRVYLQLVCVITLISFYSICLHSAAFAQAEILGEAVQLDAPNTSATQIATEQAEAAAQTEPSIQSASVLQSANVSAVNLSSRQESLDFYNANYANRSNTPMGWTGSQSSCNADSVSGAFQNQYIHRINYFRAMAGVPSDVQLASSYNQKTQQAALMMSANNRLSHGPDSSWKCYTEAGKEAAGSSNLFFGQAGIDSVDGYIKDPGGSNGHVGHRRWLLHPSTKKMGIGSVADNGDYYEANAIWVFDQSIWDERPATRDGFVAWPPPGYVPYQVAYARWSLGYPNADFSGASVSMTSNGQAVAIQTEAIANGYGENTFVWRVTDMSDYDQWPRPAQDTVYNITVRNVSIDGETRDFSYAVTLFDPAVEVATPEIDVNFNAAAPGSYLTVRGDGFTPNQQVPIELNGTLVSSAQADGNGEVVLILNTRGASQGDYLISAPVAGSTPGTAAGYNLDSAQPKRSKENLPGVESATVRNIAPLKQMYVPLVTQ